VVDIGCGGGLLSESLARLGASVVGIDPTHAAVEAARLHASSDPLTNSIDFRVSTVEELVDAKESFDLVCSLEVLCHNQRCMHLICL
jgi:ubiquinone biosynthesis O-methyltransferase